MSKIQIFKNYLYLRRLIFLIDKFWKYEVKTCYFVECHGFNDKF